MNINHKTPAAGPRKLVSEQPAAGIIQSGIRNSQPVRKSRYPIWSGVLGIFLGLAPVISGAQPPEGRGPGMNKPLGWAKGRILVMPRSGLPEKELAKVLGEHGGKGRKIGQSNLYIVDLPGNASEKAVAARLAHHPA
ncbi:MAG: peptidase S8, partial [Nitrosospira multiformis]|nr:peptidase S8 [Nitrosospira multiformis]